ncbi:P2Y purinoceptor 8-like [Lethenteron reissneri]|uniref:P2Y purinoceptor 8-like n=1 Tax=Lethenteron reissneri TaxID=7753 RepID=UPI002AB76B09|nr:P2Y purinoceptor 8-like [Lethenteron reissneri]XP_061405739.1 P2Y purinoceptor 8-like [Lethenteron reissneri]
MDGNSSSGGGSLNISKLDNFTRALLTGRLTTVALPTIYVLVFAVTLPSSVAALLMRGTRSFKPGAGRAADAAAAAAGRRPSPTSIYILNLAAVDLAFVIFLPLQIAYHYGGNHWPFGRFLCHAVTALLYLNTHCSIYFLACISVDRYLAVLHPHGFHRLRSGRFAAGACAATWALMVLATAPLHAVDLTRRVPELGVTTCYDVFPKSDAVVTFFQVYCVVFFLVIFLLPFCVTVFCYVSVIRELAKGGGGGSGGTAGGGGGGAKVGNFRRRAMRLSAVVLLMFVTCFAPCNCVLLAHALLNWIRGSSGLYGVYRLTLAFSSLSACLDPFVFYFSSYEFRRAVRRLFRRGSYSGAEVSSQEHEATSNSKV